MSSISHFYFCDRLWSWIQTLVWLFLKLYSLIFVYLSLLSMMSVQVLRVDNVIVFFFISPFGQLKVLMRIKVRRLVVILSDVWLVRRWLSIRGESSIIWDSSRSLSLWLCKVCVSSSWLKCKRRCTWSSRLDRLLKLISRVINSRESIDWYLLLDGLWTWIWTWVEIVVDLWILELIVSGSSKELPLSRTCFLLLSVIVRYSDEISRRS